MTTQHENMSSLFCWFVQGLGVPKIFSTHDLKEKDVNENGLLNDLFLGGCNQKHITRTADHSFAESIAQKCIISA
jgi:hypothetical protein